MSRSGRAQLWKIYFQIAGRRSSVFAGGMKAGRMTITKNTTPTWSFCTISILPVSSAMNSRNTARRFKKNQLPQIYTDETPIDQLLTLTLSHSEGARVKMKGLHREF